MHMQQQVRSHTSNNNDDIQAIMTENSPPHIHQSPVAVKEQVKEEQRKDQFDILESELINQTSGGKLDRRILLPLDPLPKNPEAQANFDTTEIDNSSIGETLQNRLSKMNEQKKRVNIVLDDEKY